MQTSPLRACISGLVVSVAIGLAHPLCSSVCWATPPQVSRAQKQSEHQIRAVLEANFQACNQENLRALMATCSREMPGSQQFAHEARVLFAETDVYLRLADFSLMWLKPPLACARVVQITLPADEKDRTAGDPCRVFYRGNSALLPQWECVEYTQTFKKENGRWKVLAITSTPAPIVWPPDKPVDPAAVLAE